MRRRLERLGIKVGGKIANIYLLDRYKLDAQKSGATGPGRGGGRRRIGGRKKNGGSGLQGLFGKKQISEQSGFTKLQKKVVNGKLSSFTMDIFILEGLPKTHFIATAAHELMHVWQHLFAVPENDLALREGSCNYAAYLVLRELKTPMAEYIINSYFENKDKIYGRGFLSVVSLVKRAGLKGWLDYLRNKKQ